MGPCIFQGLGPLGSHAIACSTSSSNIIRACLPQALNHHTSHPSSKGSSRAGSSSNRKGGFRRACSRTIQVQGVEGLVAVPGAVRPLPRGQRIRQSLGPLVSDLVLYSNSSNIIRALPSLRPVTTQPITPQREQAGPAAAARGEEGFGENVAAPIKFRVLRASLQCQVPYDPSRGASAYARALAPSAPIPFPAAPAATSSGRLPQALSHHTAHPSSKGSRAGSSSKGRGGIQRECSRTFQVQGVEGLVAVPGAVRPLPRSQRIRQSLDSLGSDLVHYSTSSNILRPVITQLIPTRRGSSRAGSSSKGRGGVRHACSRTSQVQGVEGLVAVPGAVRPLPRGQRISQGLGPLSSYLVLYSTGSNIIRAPPSGPESPHSSSLLKVEQ